MDYFYGISSTLESVLPITFWDVIDIFALAFIIYKGMNYMKETRAVPLTKGIFVLVIIYFLSSLFEMKALSYLFKTAMDTGIFAIIVLFQPELRRSIEKLGHSRVSGFSVFGKDNKNDTSAQWNAAIDAVCDACVDLSATKTGALIVIEMETKLGEQIENGTIIDSVPSKELFGTVFYEGTPLHDGAAIIRDGTVIAAGCFLPKPQNEERLEKNLGSRHRAAIGMSENSDAIIVVVSEETGTISVAENGELTRRYDRDSLKKYLRERVLPLKVSKNVKSSKGTQSKKASSEDKKGGSLFGKGKKDK